MWLWHDKYTEQGNQLDMAGYQHDGDVKYIWGLTPKTCDHHARSIWLINLSVCFPQNKSSVNGLDMTWSQCKIWQSLQRPHRPMAIMENRCEQYRSQSHVLRKIPWSTATNQSRTTGLHHSVWILLILCMLWWLNKSSTNDTPEWVEGLEQVKL
jgi:hypothetical protein